MSDIDENKQSYTADEMRHVVNREVMKYRLSDLESVVKRNADLSDGMFSKIFTKIDESLIEIKMLISSATTAEERARLELKREMKDEFASKIELETLRGQLNVLSTKIIVTTSVVIIAAQMLGWWIKR